MFGDTSFSFDDWSSNFHEASVIDYSSYDTYNNCYVIFSPEDLTQDSTDQAFSQKQEENLEPQELAKQLPEDNTLAPFEESEQSEPLFEPKQETKPISKKSLALLFAAGSAGLAVVTIAALAIYNAVSDSAKN